MRPRAWLFLACVSADDVRDVINVSQSEIPDAKVLKMIKRAEVTLHTFRKILKNFPKAVCLDRWLCHHSILFTNTNLKKRDYAGDISSLNENTSPRPLAHVLLRTCPPATIYVFSSQTSTHKLLPKARAASPSKACRT